MTQMLTQIFQRDKKISTRQVEKVVCYLFYSFFNLYTWRMFHFISFYNSTYDCILIPGWNFHSSVT